MKMSALTSNVKQYKKYAIATPLLVIGEVALEVLMPMIMALLITEIDPSQGGVGRLPWIGIFGAIIIGMGILSLVFGALAGRTAAIASVGFAKNTRQALYYQIQRFSFSNLDKFPTASLVTRLTTDVTNVQGAFQMIIRMMVRAPIMLIFATAMSFVMNWQLAFVFLAAIPFVGLSFFFIMKKAFPCFDMMFKKYDALNNIVEENLGGIRVVKSYVREEREIEKFKKASDDVVKFSMRAEKLLSWASPIMTFSMYACMLAIYWFGGNQIIVGNMDIGGITAFMTYGMQILMSLMMVAMVVVMLAMAKASADRISEVLESKSTIESPENALTDVIDGSIEFDDVSFDYNTADAEDAVLRHAKVSIKSGQTVGILGGTGSSKTTLVQLIPRLYDVTGGTVKVGGVDVRSYDLTALRNNVAMVLQQNILFSGSIEENLKWGNPNATSEEIELACRHAQAHDFVMSFPQGYKTDLGHGGLNVSGGQKQRLCIARALLKQPKIIILDDSTSAVDMATDAKIRTSLKNNLKDVTKIIIAQRVASVQDADKIIVMDEGNIVATGTHDELLITSEIYREVYESQTKMKAEGKAL